jgi:hypothetical protein
MRETIRTLDEIIARYELAPPLCDVYVEGSSDKGILDEFFDECPALGVVVYEIETVSVPSKLLRELSVENNNRGRVIALATVLYREFGASLPVTGVIDADLSYVFDESETCPLVLMTDYTSMEMYSFNEKALKRFVRSVCPTVGIQAKELLNRLRLPLKKLFLARIANRALGWNLKSVPFAKSMKITKAGLEISFDFDDYTTRYLSKNNFLKRQSEFKKAAKESERKSRDLDDRRCINGHDFVDMLALLCSKVKAAAEVSSGTLVGGMLRSGMRYRELASEPLFAELVARCQAT